jgi:hypothetical protein
MTATASAFRSITTSAPADANNDRKSLAASASEMRIISAKTRVTNSHSAIVALDLHPLDPSLLPLLASLGVSRL